VERPWNDSVFPKRPVHGNEETVISEDLAIGSGPEKVIGCPRKREK
jgi:hypothetical protein